MVFSGSSLGLLKVRDLAEIWFKGYGTGGDLGSDVQIFIVAQKVNKRRASIVASIFSVIAGVPVGMRTETSKQILQRSAIS